MFKVYAMGSVSKTMSPIYLACICLHFGILEPLKVCQMSYLQLIYAMYLWVYRQLTLEYFEKK